MSSSTTKKGRIRILVLPGLKKCPIKVKLSLKCKVHHRIKNRGGKPEFP